MSQVVFITGNQNKADQLAQLLGVELEHQKVSVDELQSTNLDEIVTHKVKQAYEAIGKPVLVEDVSLGFEELDGLPGPFIKFFIEQDNGLQKTCNILDGFANRRAVAACTFGYYDGQRLELFHGNLGGEITNEPRGISGYGWDAIFCPDGFSGKTSAELDSEQYELFYTQVKPFATLREFLNGLG